MSRMAYQQDMVESWIVEKVKGVRKSELAGEVEADVFKVLLCH